MNIGKFLESKGFKASFIKALKKGYEGILWNKPLKEFTKDFLGRDILLKVVMVQANCYRPWSKGLMVDQKLICILKKLSK